MSRFFNRGAAGGVRFALVFRPSGRQQGTLLMPRSTPRYPLSRARTLVASLITAWLFAVLAADVARPQTPATQRSQEHKSMNEVSGEFDVKVTPVETGDDKMGMMILDKQYHGDLDATGAGRMLTGMTAVKGSGAYVAIERVKGKLRGAEGTFLMYHTGVMAKGAQSLSIRVVPDSGTGGLAGIEGEMHIKIADGKHFYGFQYSIGGQR
jgi:Protein of unknown function (DUF3224)